jgi:hypothetical protein
MKIYVDKKPKSCADCILAVRFISDSELRCKIQPKNDGCGKILARGAIETCPLISLAETSQAAVCKEEV